MLIPRAIFLLLFLMVPFCGYGLSFKLPHNGNDLVGQVQFTQVRESEDFSDIAFRFDIGYYELLEANPGVDPDDPPLHTVLVVPTQYLLPKELQPNQILINLAEMRLYYQPRLENKVYIFPVGIGKEDWETPVGEMSIVGKAENPPWVVPQSIYKFRESIGSKVERVVPPGPNNPLGRYVIRLSKDGYLIHGTNLFAGVGRRSSAGCIRLYEKDIAQLYNLVGVGTKVTVINQPYKVGQFNQELYLEAHMPLFEERINMGDNPKLAVSLIKETIVKKGFSSRIDWEKVNQVVKEHLVLPRIVGKLLHKKPRSIKLKHFEKVAKAAS